MDAGYKQCSDGILAPTEECDDGNLVANDGCSPECRLEDRNLYKCVNVTTFGPTECCPAKTNPVTNQKVCNCKGQVSDNPGYSISEDCRFDGLIFVERAGFPFKFLLNVRDFLSNFC